MDQPESDGTETLKAPCYLLPWLLLTRSRHHNRVVRLGVSRVKPPSWRVLLFVDNVVGVEDELCILDLLIGARGLRLQEPVAVNVLV